jgi:hypothetical protein
VLIPEQELVERHGWKLAYRPYTSDAFDTLGFASFFTNLFVPGLRHLVFHPDSDYPYCQVWPARSDRAAWYIAALTNKPRLGKQELRLDGRRSAVGEGALEESLNYLGINKAANIWYYKDEGVLYESHPWVRESASNWGAIAEQTDVGIPSPVEFITQAPFATTYVPSSGLVIPIRIKDEEPKKARKIIL